MGAQVYAFSLPSVAYDFAKVASARADVMRALMVIQEQANLAARLDDTDAPVREVVICELYLEQCASHALVSRDLVAALPRS